MGFAACARPGAQNESSTALAPYDERRLGVLPDFELIDSRGQVVRKADLLGSPFVVNLFFTSCAGPCPRVQGEIRRYLYDPLEGTGVRLVSISVDPQTDSVPRLAEYARSFTADPGRWLYLTGEERAIHELVTAGLHLPLALEPSDSMDAAARLNERLELTHSTRLVVVDSEGQIAGYYGGGGETAADSLPSTEEVEAACQALLARARALAGFPPSTSVLPLVDAILNGIAATLLLMGWLAISAKRKVLHGWLMRAAFLVSAAFLVCYLTYHFTEVETRFQGTGSARVLYLLLLASHVLLAVAILPMVLRTLWLAHRKDWPRHARWGRRTLPLWLYVSVTGVAIYWILYT